MTKNPKKSQKVVEDRLILWHLQREEKKGKKRGDLEDSDYKSEPNDESGEEVNSTKEVEESDETKNSRRKKRKKTKNNENIEITPTESRKRKKKLSDIEENISSNKEVLKVDDDDEVNNARDEDVDDVSALEGDSKPKEEPPISLNVSSTPGEDKSDDKDDKSDDKEDKSKEDKSKSKEDKSDEKSDEEKNKRRRR